MMLRLLRLVLIAVSLVYLLPVGLSALLWWVGEHPSSYRDADWTSSGLLPAAVLGEEAAVYVLSARTGGLKGAVADHSWIVVKEKGAARYERWDKVGWGLPIRENAYPADGRWYSNPPRIVLSRRGEAAERLIPEIRAAITAYPFAARGGYRIFPGPNSNTFVAYVLDHVDGVSESLSPVAVGRDFPADGRLVRVDGARGDVHLSLFGYAGMTLGWTAGIEVNLLGLVAGVDPLRLGVTVPAFGRYALLQQGS